MSRTSLAIVVVLGLAALMAPLRAVGPAAIVTVKSAIDLPRPSETIVLGSAEIQPGLVVDDLRKVHVQDGATGQELLVQSVDLDDDGKFDQVVFQADFSPRQTRTFTLTAGDRQVYRREQFKAYARFVRERRDDFAWENDRIAHRMYGAALETWAQEPLTSSGVDVWVKRTRRLVINDWYMVDDYHRDNGDGADLYSVGKSRGCGGNGVWADGKLYPSKNFRNSRVLANGPVRVMFELTYEPWAVGGVSVSETKRITLDAGQNLDRFESIYGVTPLAPLQHAVGIKKPAGSQAVANRNTGTIRTWEPFKDAGFLGCGVIVDPASVVDSVEADGNLLFAAKVPAGAAAVYHAGFGWDRSGDFADVGAWDRYLEQFAARLRSPLKISLAAQ